MAQAASMSWFAWVVAAVVLCPVWWWVAKAADKLSRKEGGELGRLSGAIYWAALTTSMIPALFAAAALHQRLGIYTPDDKEIGLF